MRKTTSIIFSLFFFFLLSRAAEACSVCFGAAESPLVDGINYSILFMVGLTYTTLGGFIAFFIYLRKREKLFTDGPSGRRRQRNLGENRALN